MNTKLIPVIFLYRYFSNIIQIVYILRSWGLYVYSVLLYLTLLLPISEYKQTTLFFLQYIIFLKQHLNCFFFNRISIITFYEPIYYISYHISILFLHYTFMFSACLWCFHSAFNEIRSYSKVLYLPWFHLTHPGVVSDILVAASYSSVCS